MEEERRKYLRGKPPFSMHAVFYHLVDDEGTVSNLSEGGLQLAGQSHLAVGQEVGLVLLLPSQASNETMPILAIGEVVWQTDRKVAPTQYQCGIKFVLMLEKHRERIRQVIATLPPESLLTLK